MQNFEQKKVVQPVQPEPVISLPGIRAHNNRPYDILVYEYTHEMSITTLTMGQLTILLNSYLGVLGCMFLFQFQYELFCRRRFINKKKGHAVISTLNCHFSKFLSKNCSERDRTFRKKVIEETKNFLIAHLHSAIISMIFGMFQKLSYTLTHKNPADKKPMDQPLWRAFVKAITGTSPKTREVNPNITVAQYLDTLNLKSKERIDFYSAVLLLVHHHSLDTALPDLFRELKPDEPSTSPDPPTHGAVATVNLTELLIIHITYPVWIDMNECLTYFSHLSQEELQNVEKTVYQTASMYMKGDLTQDRVEYGFNPTLFKDKTLGNIYAQEFEGTCFKYVHLIKDFYPNTTWQSILEEENFCLTPKQMNSQQIRELQLSTRNPVITVYEGLEAKGVYYFPVEHLRMIPMIPVLCPSRETLAERRSGLLNHLEVKHIFTVLRALDQNQSQNATKENVDTILRCIKNNVKMLSTDYQPLLITEEDLPVDAGEGMQEPIQPNVSKPGPVRSDIPAPVIQNQNGISDPTPALVPTPVTGPVQSSAVLHDPASIQTDPNFNVVQYMMKMVDSTQPGGFQQDDSQPGPSKEVEKDKPSLIAAVKPTLTLGSYNTAWNSDDKAHYIRVIGDGSAHIHQPGVPPVSSPGVQPVASPGVAPVASPLPAAVEIVDLETESADVQDDEPVDDDSEYEDEEANENEPVTARRSLRSSRRTKAALIPDEVAVKMLYGESGEPAQT